MINEQTNTDLESRQTWKSRVVVIFNFAELALLFIRIFVLYSKVT